MHLYKTNYLFKKIYSSYTWDIPTTEKEIFLTFDDGPIPGVSDFVLEVLEKYNAKATFFAVGHNIEKHPEVFQRVVQGGHAVGNHTFHHLNGWKTDTNTYLDNIAECDEMLSSLYHSGSRAGGSQKLFRPPYGKLTREQSRVVRQNYKVIMWDVLTADYDNSLHKETCLKKTIKYTNKGSVVIFHDSLKAEKNMTYVLPRLLEHFSEQGYSFKAIL
jgi:peptidoglycan/xylan/chitin deacetylase (PgdA/CDA1 family)